MTGLDVLDHPTVLLDWLEGHPPDAPLWPGWSPHQLIVDYLATHGFPGAFWDNLYYLRIGDTAYDHPEWLFTFEGLTLSERTPRPTVAELAAYLREAITLTDRKAQRGDDTGRDRGDDARGLGGSGRDDRKCAS